MVTFNRDKQWEILIVSSIYSHFIISSYLLKREAYKILFTTWALINTTIRILSRQNIILS